MKCNRMSGGGRKAVVAGLALAILVLAGGCDSIGPKPWDRDLMATRGMALDADPLQSSADDHIYFSKEGSSGGRGFAGGGCGCN